MHVHTHTPDTKTNGTGCRNAPTLLRSTKLWYSGEKKVSLINGTGKTGELCAKDSNGLFTLCTKINSKYIKELNVRSEIIKLLEENIGSILFDIDLSNNFLVISP